MLAFIHLYVNVAAAWIVTKFAKTFFLSSSFNSIPERPAVAAAVVAINVPSENCYRFERSDNRDG